MVLQEDTDAARHDAENLQANRQHGFENFDDNLIYKHVFIVPENLYSHHAGKF